MTRENVMLPELERELDDSLPLRRIEYSKNRNIRKDDSMK